MTDKLNMEALNALPQPLLARFGGGDVWPIHDIEVGTGLMRIDVAGRLQVKEFCEMIEIIDDWGNTHDPDSFYLEDGEAS